jgi:hypothetical protein
LVQHSFREGRSLGRRPTFACALSALEAQGGAFAAEWLGTIVLNQLPIHFPTCARVKPPETQVVAISRNRIIPVHIEPTATRPAHLRLHATDGPERLLVERDQPWPVLRRPPASLLLAALALSGTRHAAILVGRTVLHGLAGLHPDVFAAFPALYPDEGN